MSSSAEVQSGKRLANFDVGGHDIHYEGGVNRVAGIESLDFG